MIKDVATRSPRYEMITLFIVISLVTNSMLPPQLITYYESYEIIITHKKEGSISGKSLECNPDFTTING